MPTVSAKFAYHKLPAFHSNIFVYSFSNLPVNKGSPCINRYSKFIPGMSDSVDRYNYHYSLFLFLLFGGFPCLTLFPWLLGTFCHSPFSSNFEKCPGEYKIRPYVRRWFSCCGRGKPCVCPFRKRQNENF